MQTSSSLTAGTIIQFGGDEGIEEVLHEVLRHAGSVILNRDLKRQAHAGLAARYRKAHAWPEGGGQRDLAVGAVLADGFGGVLDEVEE